MRRAVLFLAMVLVTASGCQKKAHELVFAVGGAPSEVDYWEKLVGEFESQSGIAVKMLRQPTDTDQRRQSLVIPLKAKKSDPDVFLMDVAWVGQFAASGWLLPLKPYVERDQFDTSALFRPVVEQVDIYGGELQALPVYVDCGLLYFRKDLLEKYGCSVPETWDELLQCSEKIQSKERESNPQFYGFVWQGAQYEGLVCCFLEFITSNGGKILSENGNAVLTSEQNVRALQFMMDLIHKQKISPPNTFTEMKEEEVRMFFQNGNAAFERNWPYAWKLHESDDSPVKGKVGIAVLPEFEGGRHAATLGGWHIGISKFSDSEDEAWRLVQFILSYETQKNLILNLGWNPGRKDVYDDREVGEKMPQMEIVKRALEYAVARPILPSYTQVSEALQRSVNAALSGRMEAAAALAQAEKEVKNILRTYRE
jgi:multiple sugar transport system substrate-binding protein